MHTAQPYYLGPILYSYIGTESSKVTGFFSFQISEDSPEALYESVSIPGSADGTVGVTGRPTAANGAAARRREHGYTTIAAARGETQDSSTSSDGGPDGNASNSNNVTTRPSDARAAEVPDYENIEIR